MARRILLADDSVTAQNMGRRILSDAGFTALRQEIEDLIGLNAYYRVEAETVEPGGVTAPR